MKRALERSAWLRRELQDGGLRDLISKVVQADKRKKSQERGDRSRPRKRHHRHLDPLDNPSGEELSLADQRLENSNFSVFCDKLLVLAGVLERQQGESSGSRGMGGGNSATGGATNNNNTGIRNEQELEDWLNQPSWVLGQHGGASLALKPVGKKPIPKFELVDVASSSDDNDNDEGE
jgi:hypothetical protein